ncbi:hypothetical protein PMAYCL1PPCAC_28425, partial [Pristionchus mayeri]
NLFLPPSMRLTILFALSAPLITSVALEPYMERLREKGLVEIKDGLPEVTCWISLPRITTITTCTAKNRHVPPACFAEWDGKGN